MNVNFNIWTIVQVLSGILIFRNYYIICLFVKWMFIYVKKLIAFKNISHMPIIPFIGNAYQLKPKHGKFLIVIKFVTQLYNLNLLKFLKEFLNQFVELSTAYKEQPFFIFWLGKIYYKLPLQQFYRKQ